MEFEKQLEEWMKLDYVLPEDLPNIELYMDQVTTFLEEQLKNTKRFEEDKIFTKTMINNYTKNHLLPPSNKKKYSRNHMILLIYIYYLKNFLSISDIKNLLDPLNEHFDDQDSKNSFYTIYNEIFKLEHDHKKEQLQQFAFITLLGYDIYLRKQVIEKMIDELYQPESNNKAEKKKKK
jgi:DNA-binding transcriptional MerR regulator